MQHRKRKKRDWEAKENEIQRGAQGAKYSTCPEHYPKTDRRFNRAIVPHFSPALWFIRSAKRITHERINWRFPFSFLPSSLTGTALILHLTSSPRSLAPLLTSPDLRAPGRCPYVRDVSRWRCAGHNAEHILGRVWGDRWWLWFWMGLEVGAGHAIPL